MNKLTHFFIKGLIVMFLIVLGLFLLKRWKKIFAWLLAWWIILVILAVLALPLILVILGIKYVKN